MPGFGALGEFALGEGPFAQTLPTGAQWSTPVRKAGLAIAVIAGSFTGFVPQPPAQAAPIFSQFSQPQFQRSVIPDEQPSALFEFAPPAPPFTGFCTFEGPIKAKLNVALISSRWWQPITLPVDTHDGVFVKKKRKKLDRDPIELELEEKARRRAAIELAVYGPEPEISAQISPEKPVINRPPPDVSELARMVLATREAEAERIRQEQIQAEEDDIEAILKDIL